MVETEEPTIYTNPDNVVDNFVSKMEMLMNLERNAEMEETAGLLSKYSFKVSLSLVVLNHYLYRNLKNVI